MNTARLPCTLSEKVAQKRNEKLEEDLLNTYTTLDTLLTKGLFKILNIAVDDPNRDKIWKLSSG